MSNLLDLKDKTAAVIGASSGIGRAISLLLAEHGTNVVLCARRTDKGLHAVKRIARPEEIAAAILFLVSPMSSFITGVAIPADGGNSAVK